MSFSLSGCETGELSSGGSAGGQAASTAGTKPLAYGRAVEDPASYQFKIRAELEEGEPPVFFRGSSDRILAQDNGGEKLVDEVKVPVSVGVEILDITFGGNEALEATDDGPYPVFDYINQNLYWGVEIAALNG